MHRSLAVLWFVLFGACGCGATELQQYADAWNQANAFAVEALTDLEARHEADALAVADDTTLTQEQKAVALHKVAAKYREAYIAFRAYRAALLSLRAAIVAAGLAETPDLAGLANEITNAAIAHKRFAESLP